MAILEWMLDSFSFSLLRSGDCLAQTGTCKSHLTIRPMACCWQALARQHPILYNSEKKVKSVGCKIDDMRSRLCFLYLGIPGCL